MSGYLPIILGTIAGWAILFGVSFLLGRSMVPRCETRRCNLSPSHSGYHYNRKRGIWQEEASR